jgi:hypothetical protein
MEQRKFPYIEGKRKYKRGAGEEASQIQCMFQTKSNEARHLNFTPSLPSNGRTNRQDIYHLSARGGGKKKIINNNSTQQCIRSWVVVHRAHYVENVCKEAMAVTERRAQFLAGRATLGSFFFSFYFIIKEKH